MLYLTPEQQAAVNELNLRVSEAFALEKYHDVIDICNQILKIDPRNKHAQLGVEQAKHALHQIVNNFINQAQKAEQKRNFNEAISFWKLALKSSPDNLTAVSGLESLANQLIQQAKNKQQQHKFDEAIQIWQDVLKIDPRNRIATQGIVEARNLQRAIDEAIQATIENKKHIESLLEQAQEAEEAHHPRMALEIYIQVLQDDPENETARSGLERLYPKKIDLAIIAVEQCIEHLHREGLDRGMIATFGDEFRVRQYFTYKKAEVLSALESVRKSTTGKARLYDSIADVINEFNRRGLRGRPWLLVVITDGFDNSSISYDTPIDIGYDVAKFFTIDPLSSAYLIAVGTGNKINADALTLLGKSGNFNVVSINTFLERGPDQYFRKSDRPLDYMFLIDCSASMGAFI